MMGDALPGCGKDVLALHPNAGQSDTNQMGLFGTTCKAHIAAIDVKHWDESSGRVYPCWER